MRSSFSSFSANKASHCMESDSKSSLHSLVVDGTSFFNEGVAAGAGTLAQTAKSGPTSCRRANFAGLVALLGSRKLVPPFPHRPRSQLGQPPVCALHQMLQTTTYCHRNCFDISSCESTSWTPVTCLFNFNNNLRFVCFHRLHKI